MQAAKSGELCFERHGLQCPDKKKCDDHMKRRRSTIVTKRKHLVTHASEKCDDAVVNGLESAWSMDKLPKLKKCEKSVTGANGKVHPAMQAVMA